MEKYTRRTIAPYLNQFEFLRNAHDKLKVASSLSRAHYDGKLQSTKEQRVNLGIKIRKLKVAIAQAQRGLESMRGKEQKPPYIKILKREDGLKYLQNI